MQQLPLKIMINSYCRYQQQNTFIQDCLSAMTNTIKTVDHKVIDSIKQIKQTLCLPTDPSQNQMSVIMEQETQRSVSDKLTYIRWMEKVTDQFNHQIGKLNKIDGNVDKLLDIYKNQLKNLSKYVMKWEYKNQELKKEVVKLTEENNQLKDQFARESAQIFMNQNEDIESVFDIKSKNTGKFNFSQQRQEYPKFKLKNSEKDKKIDAKKPAQRKLAIEQLIKQQKQKISTKIVSEPVELRKQQKQLNSIQVTIRQRQIEQDNQKWKKLSKKIDQLKGKLVVYEQEIEQKNQQITKLKNTIKDLKIGQTTEQQQKKKLKTANTNLRGQKTVMQNQLNQMKKNLVQKTQLCSIQQSQIIQLKTQIQNLTQTIKFQTSNINQLRDSVAKDSGKQVLEYRTRIQKLTNFNEELVKFIGVQEAQYEELNKKCQQIEQLLQLKLNSMAGKVTELQMILDQKNQCIVRMKSKGFNNENTNPNITSNTNNNAYLNELVRVLTKKVADRDEIIRRLQQAR